MFQAGCGFGAIGLKDLDMKLAHVDENGTLKGWYWPDLDKNIPEPTIEVEDAEWERSYKNNHNHVSPSGITSYVDNRTEEELIQFYRDIRDLKLETEVDPIAGNLLRWSSLTPKEQSAWAQYRSDLLNLTQTDGFPYNVTWPTKPE